MTNKRLNHSLEDTFKKYYKDQLLRSEEEVGTHLLMLKLISSNPNTTQREISKYVGISLGKTNYIIKSFITKGLVKLDNFRKANNKMAYRYVLTKSGIKEQLDLTQSFLIIRVAEYNKIENEIKNLNDEMKLLVELDKMSYSD